MVRIAVYAPAKDEEANVLDWGISAQDADAIVLVDTGSKDQTPDIAKSRGWLAGRVCISPWRFDDGFNAALAHVPEDIDIAVPLHLDERLTPGWRDELEKGWEKNGRRFSFLYEYAPGASYRHDRIHARHGFRWVGAAHESLKGEGVLVDTALRIVQRRDVGVTRDRSVDSTLIHLAYAENPTSRTAYYSAREYYYKNEWDKARALFGQYLRMPEAIYGQERSEACRLMAKMMYQQFREPWLLRSVAEAPLRREPWVDLAVHYLDVGDTSGAAYAIRRAFHTTEQTTLNSFYILTQAWDDKYLLSLTKGRRGVRQ